MNGSLEDLLDLEGEIDFSLPTSQTGPTVGFMTRSTNETSNTFSSPPQEDRKGLVLEQSLEGDIPTSLGLARSAGLLADQEPDDEDSDAESFYVESIYLKDIRRIKAPIVQLNIRGEKRVYLPDSSDGNSIWYFSSGKGIKEREIPFPEEEMLRGKCTFVNNNATHGLVVGTETTYYVNFTEPSFAPYPMDSIMQKKEIDSPINAVCFDGLKKATSRSTGPILIGTKKGKIYEWNVTLDKKNKPVSSGLVKLFDLSKDLYKKGVKGQISLDGGITGIGVIVTKKRKKKVTQTPGIEGGEIITDDALVMSVSVVVSVGCGIIEFGGETSVNSYKALFDLHIDNKKVNIINMGDSDYPSDGMIQCVKGQYVKQWAFVSMVNSGILQGNVSHSKGVAETRLLACDDVIIDVKADEFHLYVLLEKKLIVFRQPPGLCLGKSETRNMDEILIHYQCDIPGDWGRVKGIQLEADPEDEEIRWIYVYTSRGVHRVNITIRGSLRNIWRLYLHKAIESREERLFNIARALSELSEDEKEVEESQNIIMSKKAELYFERDQYSKAAQCYAQTSNNFSEIAFKFHSVEETSALQEYLELTLERISKEDYKEYTTQLVCLCTWLVELFLCQLDRPCVKHQECASKKVCKLLQKKFKGFLSKYKNNLHSPTVKRLILSHGQLALNLFYAKLSKDYETVIGHYILKNMPTKALSFLRSTCVHKKYQDVWYRFIGELIIEVPNKTVKLLKDSRLKFLSIGKILPSLLKVISSNMKDSDINKEILDYLYFALDTFRSKNKTLHNLIISLECEKEDEGEEISLLTFLKKSKYYSKSYALRKCLDNKKIKSALYLYSILELWEDGVNLALKINDIDQAKIFAESCSSISQSKRMWIKIAKQVLKTYTVKESLKLLYSNTQTTNPYLKFEKLLSYFPDSVLISDFKTEICKALENYNQEINSLRSEMINQAQDLKFIRDEIKLIRYSHFTVRQDRKCDSCKVELNQKNDLILFPCTHSFHYDCLKKEVEKYTNLENKSKDQIMEIISAECIYCGMRKINTISDDFIEDLDEVKTWMIMKSKEDVLYELNDDSSDEKQDSEEDFEDDDDDDDDDVVDEVDDFGD